MGACTDCSIFTYVRWTSGMTGTHVDVMFEGILYTAVPVKLSNNRYYIEVEMATGRKIRDHVFSNEIRVSA